jgi:hypothetical protein
MTAASLPSFADHEALRTFRAEPAQWLPIALDIARRGLAGTAPHVFSPPAPISWWRLMKTHPEDFPALPSFSIRF